MRSDTSLAEPSPQTSNVSAGLLRSGSGYLIADAGSRAILFILLIAAAALLPLQSFAWVSLYIVFANAAAMIVGLGTPSAVNRLYFRGPPFSNVLGVTFLSVGASGLILIAGAIAFQPALVSLLQIPPEILVASALGAPFIALRNAFISTLRARGRVRQTLFIQLGEVALAGAAMLGFAYSSDITHVTTVAALLGSTATTAAVAIVSWARDPGITFDLGTARPVLRFASPLILQGLAAYLIASHGQVLANVLLGADDAGMYAYAYRFGMAMLLVSTAFSAAWSPAFLMAAELPTARIAIEGRVRYYWALLLAISGALMFLLPIFARALASNEYLAATRLIPVIVYAYVWHVAYNLVAVFQLEANRTGTLAAGTSLALGISVAVSVPMTIWFGLPGLAVSAPFSYAVLFGIQAILGWHLRRKSALGRDPWAFIVISGAAAGLLPAVLWVIGFPA
jgi:O-antigen/teichoic acid export membrane protein